jgi:hypothetical protein
VPVGSKEKLICVVRSRSQAVGLALTGLFASIGFSIEAARASDQPATWIRVAFAATGLLLGLFMLMRMARSGAYVFTSGVRIKNPFGSRFVPWEAIRRFTLHAWGPFPKMGHAVLGDGTEVHIWGIQAPNPLFRPRNRSSDELIERLNRLHAEVTARPP